MGTDKGAQRVLTDRDQEDLPVSEEKLERRAGGERGAAPVRGRGIAEAAVSERPGDG